jgi:hypothetical protein
VESFALAWLAAIWAAVDMAGFLSSKNIEGRSPRRVARETALYFLLYRAGSKRFPGS